MLRALKRRVSALLAVMAMACSVTLGSAVASPPTCAGDLRGNCLVRPHILVTGAHTVVRSIHWHAWTGSTALGFGRLIETGGATYPGFKKPAKIRLRLPAECNGRGWFWSMTITFGHNYGQRYLHNYDYTPC